MLSVGEAQGLFAGNSRSDLFATGVVRSAKAPVANNSTGDSLGSSGGRGSVAVPQGATTADAGVKAYQQAAQKMVAAAGGEAAATTDPKVAAQLARLKAADTAVRAHEAAHVAAGGSYVRGGASFTYEVGPDGKQYAVAGEVGIDISAVPGDPQATILKMITVRAAALAPADPSSTDRAVAAAASQAEAAARAELSQQEANPAQAAKTEQSPANPLQPGQVASDLVQSTYTTANEPEMEPMFQVAA